MFVASNLQVVEQRAFNVLQPLPLGASPQSIGQKLIDIRLSLIPSAGSTAYGCSTITTSKCACSSFCVYSAAWCDDAHDVRGVVALRRRGIRLLRLPALNMVLPLLVTNIVATLMAYKMWCAMSSTDQNAARLPEEQETKVEGILVILPESGVLYCLIWIPFLYMILANQGEETTSYKIVANMIPQLSVIYLVLLVSLDRTDFESTIISISTNADSDPIHFVSNTTGTGTATTGTLRMGVPIRLADASRSSDVNLAVVEETENGAAEPAIPFRG
ncbi:hypothetical protein C8J57DRAFT_1637143 [Mycena rebaudengoi]|nr:hypothetical protein C8J57DRAFT_1637143 [Mycena rebaudengoi]